jgi:hypothetical protein
MQLQFASFTIVFFSFSAVGVGLSLENLLNWLHQLLLPNAGQC